MDDEQARTYSETFREHREAFEKLYLTDPATVLYEAIDRLKDSLRHHRDDSDPRIAMDANWLLDRMDELASAIIIARANLKEDEALYANFSKRFVSDRNEKLE